MAAPTKTTEIYVVKNVPTDVELTPDCMAVREADVPPLAANSLLIRTACIGLEPYMRVFCINNPQNWKPDSVPSAQLVGEVIQTTCDKCAVGDVVKVSAGFRTITWVEVGEKTRVEKLDSSVPPQLFLGLCGSGGRTAGLNMKHVAKPTSGQTCVVTAASGCVGLAAVQLLVLDGVKVAASAGSPDKIALLESLGCTAWNYKNESTKDALARICPDGVDFLLDMVGGKMRSEVIQTMRAGGKILTLGSMSGYDGGDGHKVKSDEAEVAVLKEKDVTALTGQVGNYESEYDSFTAELVELFKQGKIVNKDTVVEGLEQLPSAFVGIFKGANIGRMVVKVS